MGLTRLVKKIAAAGTWATATRVANVAVRLQIAREKFKWGQPETRQDLNNRLRKAFKEGWPITIEEALSYDENLRARLKNALKEGSSQLYLEHNLDGGNQNILGRDSRLRKVLLSGPIYDVAYLNSLELRLNRDQRRQNPFDSEAIFKIAVALLDFQGEIEKNDLQDTKFVDWADRSKISRIELGAELCRRVLMINPNHSGALQCLAECLEKNRWKGLIAIEPIAIEPRDWANTSLGVLNPSEINNHRSALTKELKEKAEIQRHVSPEKPKCITAFLTHIQNRAKDISVRQDEILKGLDTDNDSNIVVPKAVR